MVKAKYIPLLILFVFLSIAGKTEIRLSHQTDTSVLPKHFRFIYNSDANNMFLGTPPMTPNKIESYINDVARAGVTSFFISPNWGMPMNFPTKVGDMIGEHLSKELEATLSKNQPVMNFRNLLDSVQDPLGFMLDRAKSNKMETFVSFRLNEVHDVEKEESAIFDRFWRAHPEWRIGNPGDPLSDVYKDIMGPRTHPIVNSWLPGGLNFAIPEVRKYRMAQLQEICERYDIDGLELDFQRFPMYFKPGEEKRGVRIMSDWMLEVRAMVAAAGKKRGRPILLTARIMALPEQNKAIGIDPVSWAKNGIVDFVVVAHYLHNNFQLPIEEYRSAFPENFAIYASVEVEPGIDRFLNIVYPLWQKKVHGINFFNYFFPRVKENDPIPPYDSIRQLGYPIIAKDSVLLVVNKGSNTLSYVNPKTFEIIKSITTGANPSAIVVTPDQRTAYVSHFEHNQDHLQNKVSGIDLLSGQMKEISTSYYGRLHGAAISPDGRYAYFTSTYLGYVVEIETSGNKFVRAIPTYGRNPNMVYISPDGKYLFTTNTSSGDISVIDRSTGHLQKKIQSGKGIEAMMFTPDRRFLWALNRTAGNIMIIDMRTLGPIKTFNCRDMPSRIKFTTDGRKALVTGGMKEGVLTVIDVLTLKEIKRISVGSYAMDVILSPDDKHAFVGCGNLLDAKVSDLTKEQKANGIYVVDMKKLEVASIIETGFGPTAMEMWYPKAD